MSRPTLVESRWARTLLFPALYFAQGVPWGFVSVGYVVMLTDLGLDDATIGGLLGLAYLPWSFKFVAGPVLDRIPMLRMGRRRPVVMLAEFVMGASLLGLLFVDPAHDVTLTSAILFVHNACAALQDVAVDALAVDVLPEEERGRANSYMWAAKSGGIMVGGSFGTLVAGRFGWPAVFVMLVLVLWAVLGVVVWILERPQETVHDAPADHLSLAALRRAFGFPTPWLAVVVGLVSPVGYAIVATPFTTLTRGELGWSDEQIAMSAFVDPWVGIAGALVGGWLADRYGSRRAMATGLLAIAGLLAGFAGCAPAWQSFAFTLGFAAVLGFLTNLYGAASLGYFMSLCDPAVGATQFSMYMATTNLTYAWTSAAGGWISDRYGHATLFLFAGAIQVAAISSLLLADPAVARARYAQASA
ncbi:MAG: MFS transporter [Myxococcales bacterium]|nr:MFS transporter [Myxococcales bacterium]